MGSLPKFLTENQFLCKSIHDHQYVLTLCTSSRERLPLVTLLPAITMSLTNSCPVSFTRRTSKQERKNIMPFTFAAVTAWLLLFKLVEAQVGFNYTIEAIYDAYVNQGDRDEGLSEALGLAWKTVGDKDLLLVEVTATGPGAVTLLESTVEAYGFQITACSEYRCSGWATIDSVLAFTDDPNVKAIKPSIRMTEQAGSKVSEAVQSLRVDLVRQADPTLTGEGLRIGIMSDSFDRLRTYAQDVLTGDLPSDVTVLKEYTGDNFKDEGRGMAQLIYDLAPNAKLFYRTAFNGQDDFAKGIEVLANANCTVIVDDICTLFHKGWLFLYPKIPY